MYLLDREDLSERFLEMQGIIEESSSWAATHPYYMSGVAYLPPAERMMDHRPVTITVVAFL